MSKAWGKIGAWAAEAELAEAEERELASAAAAVSVEGGVRDSQNFPSLREAVNTKQKKKTKMTLHEFTVQSSGKGLTAEEMLRLPTGPKERSPEEMQYGRLGGGFSSYGRSSGGPPSGRARDRDGGDDDRSWGTNNRRSYGGFDDDRRGPPPRDWEFDQPSRADEVDNWAMGKKPLPSYESNRPSRYGSLGGSSSGGFSRADETDNWATNKKPVQTRPSSLGTGFRDSRPEPDRWSRGSFSEGNQERRRLVLDPPRSEGTPIEPVVVKSNRPNPFGAARPREEILGEKGLDWKKVDMEIEAKKIVSRPTSSQSNSRPGSSQSIRSEGPAALQGLEKPGPKANPFGDAKPREILLQEKGLDWRKIDLQLEHRSVDRTETAEEKNLRGEIEDLKRELDAGKKSMQDSDENRAQLRNVILLKEKELEQLIHALDDKVRFGQKAVQRPGSGAGRVVGFQERPHSQSGSFEEIRSVDFVERPRSRGTADVWVNQGDEGRAFPGGMEGGFPGNRGINRSRSRERW